MNDGDKGPRSEFARYAYGYSDKKPGLAFWIIQGIVLLGAVASCVQATR